MQRRLIHAPGDRFVARRLKQALEEYGFEIECFELPPEASLVDLPVRDAETALAVGLSAEALETRWLGYELLPALSALGARLPLTVVRFGDCELPEALHGLSLADLSPPNDVEDAVKLLASSLSFQAPPPARNAQVHVAARPKVWHCIDCGTRHSEGYNDYRCVGCDAMRPFMGGSATHVICPACDRQSLAVARYCEWCGRTLR